MSDQLTEKVAKVLRVLSYAALRYAQQFDPDNGKQVGVYVAACRDLGVTPEAVELAGRRMMRDLREWPPAGEFAERCKSAQDTLRNREVSRYVQCLLPSGDTAMAPPERVRDGYLLPEGDLSGNGQPLKALPAPPPLSATAQRVRNMTPAQREQAKAGMMERLGWRTERPQRRDSRPQRVGE